MASVSVVDGLFTFYPSLIKRRANTCSWPFIGEIGTLITRQIRETRPKIADRLP